MRIDGDGLQAGMGIGQDVPVTEHHPLGPAGSAGGIDDGGQLVGSALAGHEIAALPRRQPLLRPAQAGILPRSHPLQGDDPL